MYYTDFIFNTPWHIMPRILNIVCEKSGIRYKSFLDIFSLKNVLKNLTNY